MRNKLSASKHLRGRNTKNHLEGLGMAEGADFCIIYE